MVTGHGSRDHADARRLAYRDPAGFQQLIDRIVEATVAYLSSQIEAGVHAVQLLDSWAGSLAPAQFAKWGVAPKAEIVPRLKALPPHTPIIGLPKGADRKSYVEGKSVSERVNTGCRRI